jgi:pyridoxal phosphate enzyme (YggS family)
MTIADRVAEVRQRIASSAERAGRDGSEIRLVAVSKTFPASAIAEALRAGVTDFGENRAQELIEKAPECEQRVRWHFVGHLQTNKVRAVTGQAVLIHGVDSLRLAEAIDRRASRLNLVQDILIEVNVAADPTKHGIGVDDVLPLARRVARLEAVRLNGVMTMPPYPTDAEDSRPFYKELAAVGRDLSAEIDGAGDLSMGMTRDFEVAIEEGATIVRVGEAIFGARKTR